MADLRQQLSNLDDKLAKLHERAKAKSVSDDSSTSYVERDRDEVKLITQSIYRVFQVMIDTLKSRTDDLSKISFNVLKYYSSKEKELDAAERRFYDRYVKPAKPFL